VWLAQFVGRDILLLDYATGCGQPASWFAGKCMEWERKHGVPIRKHYLPHDADTRDRGSGKTYTQSLLDAGLRDCVVVPRTPDIWLGINSTRELFPRLHIHATNCNERPKGEGERTLPSGLDCLEYYHRKEVNQNGIIGEQPVHDEFSHGADAIRTMGEAYRLGMLEGTSLSAKESRAVAKPVKVLRGPGPQSYSVGAKRTAIR
jgi:phage terminase large subunit